MKINPTLTVVQGQKTSPSRSPTRRSTGNEVVFTTEQPAATQDRDIVRVISLENQKAANSSPPGDLDAAEALLSQLQGNLGSMTRKELGGIHRLEGLVQFYAT
ncbi:MAG: hypothetical protein V1816_02680 [Pseudomonadota bacterium]